MWSSLYAAAAAAAPPHFVAASAAAVPASFVAAPAAPISAPPPAAALSIPLFLVAGCSIQPSTSTAASYVTESRESSNKDSPLGTPQSVADDTNFDPRQRCWCNHCEKDFRRPDILARHMRLHTGEKPFRCELCRRNFSRSDHLRTHVRTHSEEKPYACPHCRYAARRRDVLTRHIGTRHKGKREQPIDPKREAQGCRSGKTKDKTEEEKEELGPLPSHASRESTRESSLNDSPANEDYYSDDEEILEVL